MDLIHFYNSINISKLKFSYINKQYYKKKWKDKECAKVFYIKKLYFLYSNKVSQTCKIKTKEVEIVLNIK